MSVRRVPLLNRDDGKRRGFIHLYMGEGEGKTLAAIGAAVRAIGHGYKVIIVQFMKGRKDIGEYKIRERLAPEYEIHQFGREVFIDLRKPDPIDYELAREGLKFAREALRRKPKLLILDEVSLAAAVGLVDVDDVLDLLREVPPSTVVILTGRRAPREFIEIADLVSEVREVKHPMRAGVKARKGIEY